MESRSLESYKTADKTAGTGKTNLWMSVAAVPLFILFIIPYAILWGVPQFTTTELVVLLAGYVVLILAHELLHAFGYMYFGGASRREVKLGIFWKALVPYAHCKVPLKVRPYRQAILLPVILGIIPTVAAYMTGSHVLFILGLVMLLGSLGDFFILWLLRGVSKDAFVQDHPEKIGCTVYIKEDV